MDWEALSRWIDALGAAELFAFDTETTSLDYMTTEIVGVSFCIEPGHAAYVPLAHDYAGAPPQLDRLRVLEALRPLLEDPEHCKVGQHLKFDIHVLQNYGIALRGQRYDTMLESYVLNSTATRHDMDSMARTCWACAPFTSRTSPARAPSRSRSTRSAWRKPRNTRPKTPT